MSDVGYTGWAILELMGHRRLGGCVAPVDQYGAPMLRIDVPESGIYPAYTQYYSPASIYCLTPTTEDAARRVAVHYAQPDVLRLELPSPSADDDSSVGVSHRPDSTAHPCFVSPSADDDSDVCF